MKRTILLAVVLAMVTCSVAWGQDKPQEQAAASASVKPPTEALKPIIASVESQNAILKAEHDLDSVKSDLADITQQYTDLQRAADRLTPRYKADQEKQKSAEVAVGTALDGVYKANGVSKDKYNFDPANFTFTPKPETPPAPKIAQAAPAPAK